MAKICDRALLYKEVGEVTLARPHITKVFLGFFLFSLILPMALMEGLWIRAMLAIHEQRFHELLETGKQLAISELDGKLEQLELKATHNAAYLETQGSLSPSDCNQALSPFPAGYGFRVLDLSTGKRLCRLGEPVPKEIYRPLLKGPTHDVRALVTWHNQPFLLVSVPFRYRHAGGQLIVSQPLKIQELFTALRPVLPGVHISWSATPPRMNDPEEQRIHPLSPHGSQGYLLISLSDQQEDALITGGWVATITSMILGLLTIGGIGWWLSRSLINPIESVAEMASTVTAGRLNHRIPRSNSLPEVNTMIDQLNQMLDRLQADVVMQQGFVASLTHDLRTPLLAEQRVIELIQEEQSLPEAYQRLLNQLKKNNQHLLTMVNLLLEMYQFESGRVAVQPSLLLVDTLVQNCMELLLPLAEEKHITLQYEPSPPMKVWADPILLRRVLLNLMSNAIANIPEYGDIMVQFRPGEAFQQLLIADNGPGLPAEALPHMFDPYQGIRRQKIGSGLGLSICKKIVEAHQGKISVSCPASGGTVFLLELPVQTD